MPSEGGGAEIEVLVLGGGPAGAAAALGLGRLGICAVLVDAARPVAPRVESLPFQGTALARDCGMGRAVEAALIGRASGMLMHWRAAPERLGYPAASAPVLLDRRRLHRAGLAAVRRAGVAVLTGRAHDLARAGAGVAVRINGRQVTARLVIDARGRSAPGRATGPESQVALPFRCAMPGLAQFEMQLQALTRGWLWAVADGTRAGSGAIFLSPKVLSGTGTQGHALLAGEFLHEAGLECHEGLWIGRPEPASLRPAPALARDGTMLRVGDAALARDPVAAHGLLHALRSGAQAAIAARTILRGGCADAARSFVETRHSAAVEAASRATARALADQSRHHTAFWRPHARKPERALPMPRPAADDMLRLARPPRRAAVLEAETIRWAPCLHLPARGEDVAHIGPLDAGRIAAALHPPASLSELAARLRRLVPGGTGGDIAELLLREGALVPEEIPRPCDAGLA